MTTLKLKYVNTFIDRHGRPRAYFRHRGDAWPMPLPIGSPAFLERYQEYLKRLDNPATIPSKRVGYLKGSIGWTIEQYLAHREFLSKKPGTQAGYRIKLDLIKTLVGAALLRDLTAGNIRVLRDKLAESRGT